MLVAPDYLSTVYLSIEVAMCCNGSRRCNGDERRRRCKSHLAPLPFPRQRRLALARSLIAAGGGGVLKSVIWILDVARVHIPWPPRAAQSEYFPGRSDIGAFA